MLKGEKKDKDSFLESRGNREATYDSSRTTLVLDGSADYFL